MDSVFIRTSFWNSEVVKKLSAEKKSQAILLYISLITHPDQKPSGIFRFSVEDSAQVLGTSCKKLTASLKTLIKNDVVLYSKGWVFVIKFLSKTWKNNGNQVSDKIKTNIIKQFKNNNIPSNIIQLFNRLYPDTLSHTPSHTLPDTPCHTQGHTKEIGDRSIEIEDKIKEKTNKKEKIFVLPDFIPQDTWTAYLEMRKKKPPTHKAKELLVAKMKKLKNQGHDPQIVLNQSIINAWTDVYPIKNQSKTQGYKQNKDVGKNDGQPLDKEQLLDNAWEYVSAMIELDPEWKPPKDATPDVIKCFDEMKKHE
jgi:hypothetical protein